MRNNLVLAVITFIFSLAPVANAAQVVIVGGSGTSSPEVVARAEDTFNGTFVELRKVWPLSSAAKDLLEHLQEKGIDTKNGLILVGFSWGGLVARQLDAENPGMVEMIVTIGSVSGGYRFMPEDLFMPKDSNSKTPLYVIGGYDPLLPKRRWFMRKDTTKNDGVVSLESAFAIGRPTMEMKAFSGYNHFSLMESTEVSDQIHAWITNKPPKEILLSAIK